MQSSDKDIEIMHFSFTKLSQNHSRILEDFFCIFVANDPKNAIIPSI